MENARKPPRSTSSTSVSSVLNEKIQTLRDLNDAYEIKIDNKTLELFRRDKNDANDTNHNNAVKFLSTCLKEFLDKDIKPYLNRRKSTGEAETNSDTKPSSPKELVLPKVKSIKFHRSIEVEEFINNWSKEFHVKIERKRPIIKYKIAIIGSGDVARKCMEDVVNKFNKKWKEKEIESDIDLELVMLGRNQKALDSIILDFKGSTQKEIKKPDNFKIYGSTDEACLKGSNVVFMTAGIRAGLIAAESRNESLLYNFELLKKYGEAIKKHAPECLLIVITNPVEHCSRILQIISGLPPQKVVASGNELDAKRLLRELNKELKKYHIDVKLDRPKIIGEHSKDGMIPLLSQITFNGGKLLEDLVKTESKSRLIEETELKNLLKEGQNLVRNEGMMYNKGGNNQGSSDMPARSSVNVAIAYLGLSKAKDYCLGIISEEDFEFFGVDIPKGVAVGLPVIIEQGQINIDTKISLDGDHKKLLAEVIKDRLTQTANLLGKKEKELKDILSDPNEISDLLLKSKEKNEKLRGPKFIDNLARSVKSQLEKKHKIEKIGVDLLREVFEIDDKEKSFSFKKVVVKENYKDDEAKLIEILQHKIRDWALESGVESPIVTVEKDQETDRIYLKASERLALVAMEFIFKDEQFHQRSRS